MLVLGRRLGPVALVIALVSLVIATAGPAAAATPTLPENDSFYTYSGSAPLAGMPAGTILKTRQISVTLAGVATPFNADQLLYRTTNELGGASLAVTTVIKPALGVSLTNNIVSDQTAYDSLTGRCNPSYTLQGGGINDPDNATAKQESALLVPYLAAGDYVVVSDYEGVNNRWAAGHESGYGTLDGIRAAEADLKLPASNKVAMVGYSGGAIASEWASELAPTYAPDLNIVGVAEGGIAVDFAHNLDYINGSQQWSGIIPAVLYALSQAYGVDVNKYLNSYGAKLVAGDAHGCINGFLGSHPGLKYQQMLKPQYSNIYAIKPLVTIINNLIMGSAPGHPKGPLYMENGQHDGTGDDVMVAGDVRALAREYCAQGVTVNYVQDDGSSFNHGTVGAKFEATSAPPQVAAWFSGLPATNNCSSIAAGNSLAPLALQTQPVTSAPSTPAKSAPTTLSADPSTGVANTGSHTIYLLLLGIALAMLGLNLVLAGVPGVIRPRAIRRARSAGRAR